MAVAPRLARFTTKSESSDYVNNLSINRLDGDDVLPEVPGSIANFSFDPAGNVGFLFADFIGPLASARVQLWSDLNNNGVIDDLNDDAVVDPGDDVPSVPNVLLSALTWEQVITASNNGANDVILAIDDDGNVSDGDFNDMVVAGEIERETPPDEDCLVSEVKLTTVYEESGYFNSLSIVGNETVAGDTPITEAIGDTATIRFDALDNTPGDFFLNTGNDGSASRVKLFVDSNDNDLYDFGVDAAIPGSEQLVNDLTWKDLADAWQNNGQKDLLVAIDDDGNSSDGDFNDIVLLAQFTEPDCKDECEVTEATFTTVYEESGYFNTLQINRGVTVLASIDETDGDTAVVSFDGSETFSLLTGNDGLAASVKLYFDTNANGEYDFGTDEFVAGSQQLLSELSWDDLLGASANGTKDLFIAVDDDGNSSDGDFNDIVVLFRATPCEDDCDCGEEQFYPILDTALIA